MFIQVLDNVRKGYQVMVFVHARNATVITAERLRDLAMGCVVVALLYETIQYYISIACMFECDHLGLFISIRSSNELPHSTISNQQMIY